MLGMRSLVWLELHVPGSVSLRFVSCCRAFYVWVSSADHHSLHHKGRSRLRWRMV
jgi:hypothetical protein